MNDLATAAQSNTETTSNAVPAIGAEDSWKCCNCRHENYYDKSTCNGCGHSRCNNCKDLLG